MNRAIFAGTFDPVHYGHIDVVKAASKLFDRVVWLMAKNGAKKNCQFALDTRRAMMEQVIKNEKLENVVVESAPYPLALVDVAQALDAQFLVRSFRLTSDFEYELQMSLVNRQLDGDIQTVFLPPLQEHLHISSTTVREVILLHRPLTAFMPEYLSSLFF